MIYYLIPVGIIGLLYSVVIFIQKQFSMTTLFIDPIYYGDLDIFGKLLFIISFCKKSIVLFILSIILIYIGVVR